MQKTIWLVSLLGLALLAGCSRARVTTEIRPDGSFTRTVLFSGPPKQDNGMQVPSIEDTFVLPSGPAWKVTDGKQGGDVTKTFVRTVAAGGSLKGDVAVREDKASAKTQVLNEVTVTRLGPKRFEYKETLRWTGAPVNDFAPKPEDLAAIKAALPKPLATDANAKAVVDRAYGLILPMIFGPNDLLLSVSLLHPDLAERRAHSKIGGALIKALEEQFGDQMTVDQRREVARKLIESSFSSSRPSQPDAGGGGSGDKKNSNLTALTFVLRAPGKLVSSNGEIDDLTGEVYWALYPEAASVQPVVLTATYEVP